SASSSSCSRLSCDTFSGAQPAPDSETSMRRCSLVRSCSSFSSVARSRRIFCLAIPGVRLPTGGRIVSLARGALHPGTPQAPPRRTRAAGGYNQDTFMTTWLPLAAVALVALGALVVALRAARRGGGDEAHLARALRQEQGRLEQA